MSRYISDITQDRDIRKVTANRQDTPSNRKTSDDLESPLNVILANRDRSCANAVCPRPNRAKSGNYNAVLLRMIFFLLNLAAKSVVNVCNLALYKTRVERPWQGAVRNVHQQLSASSRTLQ